MNDVYRQYLASNEWKDVSCRRRVIDGNQCVICGKYGYTEVHHVRYPKNIGDTSVDDLVTLCKDCHVMLHRLQETYDKWGYMAKPTKYGTLSNDAEWIPTFKDLCERIVGVELWRQNKLSTADVSKFVRKVNDIIEMDNKRYKFTINIERIMAKLAFVKDCLIANDNPKFNAERRKYQANIKSKYH